jgi:dienelactone hydrolase
LVKDRFDRYFADRDRAFTAQISSMCRKKISFYLAAALYLVSAFPVAGQQIVPNDPFAPFLTGNPPRKIKTLSAEIFQNIKIERIIFHSRDEKSGQINEESMIFAAIYRPNDNKQYPGLLILHGGQGAAETEKAMAWARRGYVVVAPDLPGIADPEKIPFSRGGWKIKTPAAYIAASPDVTASPIFDAVLAAVQSLYLLRSQPNVLKEKIGVIGYAWGGYVATMTAGLTGKDVTAVFSVFGTGFYDAGSFWQEKLVRLPAREREEWLRFLDAGRRAPQIKAQYFLATSTNHPYFWLPSAIATLNAVKSPKNQVFVANATTDLPIPGGTKPPGEASQNWTEMEKNFFAYYLKGAGTSFPVVTLLSDFKVEADVVRTRFRVEGAAAEVSAYYGLTATAADARQWKKALAVTKVGKDIYEAIIPIGAAREGADWYAVAAGSPPAAVSSLIGKVPVPK